MTTQLSHSQNFIRDSRLAEALVSQARLPASALVLEIGPGKGILTRALAKHNLKVLAIEKDARLAAQLRQEFRHTSLVQIQTADILAVDLPRPPYHVFANIPFNLTADIVARLTSGPRQPDSAHLIMQREAAGRFMGAPAETLRSLCLKPWVDMSLVHHFQREDFTPVPRVQVVMLRMEKRGPPLVSPELSQLYRDFVVAVFTAWKPTLKEALGVAFSRGQIQQLARQPGLDLQTSPSRTPFAQWLRLFEVFHTHALEARRGSIHGAEKRLASQQARLRKIHRTRVTDPPARLFTM